MNIDWEKEGASGNFETYPEGTYRVAISGYEQVTASTGTPQIRWKATILEPAELLGKPLTTHTPLTEKSLWKIARLVKACGVDLKALGTMELESKAFFNVLSRCVRRTTFWHLLITPDLKGKPRNEVDDFQIDNEQEVVTVEEDIPEFLKE